MIFWLSLTSIVCATALAIAMLLTGHDALLDRAIVAWAPVAKQVGTYAFIAIGPWVFLCALRRLASS